MKHQNGSTLIKTFSFWHIVLGLSFLLALASTTHAKTYYVVAMGDSMTSGEGAPDKRANRNDGFAQWGDNVLCHRSFSSYATRSINMLRSEIDEGDRIVYKNFACSGAKIFDGIVNFQEKRLASGGIVQVSPQIEQVQEWMAEQGIESLDAIIMSIGINDIDFANVVTDCVTPRVSNCTKDFVDTTGQVMNAILGSGYQAGLRYNMVDTLKPKQVFVMEYPDPLRDAAGQFCDRYDDGYSVLDGGPLYLFGHQLPVLGSVQNISYNESEAAYTLILNILNTYIRSFVMNMSNDTTNWTYVDGTMLATRTHGYCAGSNRYFNHFRDSNLKQLDLNGSLHPNDNGYQAIAEVLMEPLRSILVDENPTFFIPPRILPILPLDGDFQFRNSN
jgi:lysophospholipase L1-like esterase